MNFHLLVLIGAVFLLALVVGIVLCIGWVQHRFEKDLDGGVGSDAPVEIEKAARSGLHDIKE